MRNYFPYSLFLAALFFNFFTPLGFCEDVRFGIIDVKRIFLNYKETQHRKQALAKEIDSLQTEIDVKKKSVDELKEKIEALGKTLKPGDQSLKAKKTLEEMRALQESYREKMEELREIYKKYSMQLQSKEEKEIMAIEKELEDKVQPILEGIARKRKFIGVFEKRSVFFGGEDITDEILETLNKSK